MHVVVLLESWVATPSVEECLAIHACSLGECIEHIYSLMTNCMVYHVGGRGRGTWGGRDYLQCEKAHMILHHASSGCNYKPRAL